MSERPAVTRARTAYRKVRDAAGVAELPALEGRVDRLDVGVAEELALTIALSAVVAQVEASLVPVLEARARRSVTQDTPHSTPHST